jgi:hypothetical protein
MVQEELIQKLIASIGWTCGAGCRGFKDVQRFKTICLARSSKDGGIALQEFLQLWESS